MSKSLGSKLPAAAAITLFKLNALLQALLQLSVLLSALLCSVYCFELKLLCSGALQKLPYSDALQKLLCSGALQKLPPTLWITGQESQSSYLHFSQASFRSAKTKNTFHGQHMSTKSRRFHSLLLNYQQFQTRNFFLIPKFLAHTIQNHHLFRKHIVCTSTILIQYTFANSNDK